MTGPDPNTAARLTVSAPAARHVGWPVVIAVATFLISAITRDPAGNLPSLPAGPGLTLDEVYNVEMGVYLVQTTRSYGLGILSFDSVREIFGAPGYNPDHPPLGRVALGLSHAIGQWWHGRSPRDFYVTVDARIAPALAFAVTIWLVGRITGRWYGRRAGLIAAVALPLTPRLFGHSHLAALETFVGLAYSAVILIVAETWSRPLMVRATGSRPTVFRRDVLIAGLLLGLAMLTKIQGFLACVPIGLWGLWNFRSRAIGPGLVLGLTAFLVFFVGWPWLWLNPRIHLMRYFGSATARPVLYCFYEGIKFADRDVPWHYPFVIFATTVPLGLHLLGLTGLFSRTGGAIRTGGPPASTPSTQPSASPPDLRPIRDPRLQLVLIAILFPLVLFAWPGIAVYDGERLFLICYPLWGVFIGRGGAVLWSWIERRLRGASAGTLEPAGSLSSLRATRHALSAGVIIGAFLTAQACGHWTTWPFLLSHYNLAVGGLRGASSLGFERSYWGESLNRTFQSEIVRLLPKGSTLYVAPVLHPLQLPDLEAQSRILQRHEIRLTAYDDQIRDRVLYVVVHRRMADPWASLDESRAARSGFRLLAEVRREGVQLAALYESVTGDAKPAQ